MKKIVLGAVLTASVAASAAATKKTTKTAKASTKAAVVASAPAAAQTAAAPVMAAASDTAIERTADNTTTASATSLAPAAKPSKVGGSLALWPHTNLDAMNKDSARAEIGTDNQIKVKYKLNDKETVALGQDWSTNRKATADGGTEWKSEQYNPHVSYKRALGKLAGSDDIVLDSRYYAPVIQTTRATGDGELRRFNGVVRFDTEIGWTLTPKVSAGIALSPRFTLNAVEPVSARFLHNGFARYAVSDKVSFYQNLGFDTRTKSLSRLGTAKEVTVNTLELETGADLSLAKSFALTVAFSSSTDATGKEDQTPYDAKYTDFNLIGVMSF